MDEDDTFPETMYPLTTFMQERVDRILLAIAGRLWELRRDMTPSGQHAVQEPWQEKATRSSPLGQQIMLIAHFLDRSYYRLGRSQIEPAMRRILRMVFGNPFDEGYTVPAQFHTTELGKLFHEASTRMYRSKDLFTVKQASQEVGVARQSVYDRIADGKLHPIYVHGNQRLLRSEIEEWKVQRQQ